MELFESKTFSVRINFWNQVPKKYISNFFAKLFLRLTKLHSERSQTSRTERFAKIPNG